jgi:hypothetical protein
MSRKLQGFSDNPLAQLIRLGPPDPATGLVNPLSDGHGSRKVLIMEEGKEECSSCHEPTKDKRTYYRPQCGHLFCYWCMDRRPRLNACTKCTQPFATAEAVLVRVAIKADDGEDT